MYPAMSHAEIGKALGICKDTVRKLERTALCKLRKSGKLRLIYDQMQTPRRSNNIGSPHRDEIYSEAVNG
jgi:transcriptional regulator